MCLRTAFACAVIAMSCPVMALPSDADAPLQISCDVLEGNLDEFVILQGECRLQQGTMIIEAEHVQVDLKDGNPSSFRAHGTPVHMSHEPTPGDKVQLTAQSITVDLELMSAELKGQVELKSGPNHVRGDSIRYNANTGHFSVESDSEADRQVEVMWEWDTEEP